MYIESRRLATMIEKRLGEKSKSSDIQDICCRAIWRDITLVIYPLKCHPFRQSVSFAFKGNRSHILACLRKSNIKRILLSYKLPVSELLFWQELGQIVGLETYVNLPKKSKARSHSRLLNFKNRLLNGVIKIRDIFASLMILILLSPLLLWVSIFLTLKMRGILEKKVQIGRNGKLFVGLYFRHLERDNSNFSSVYNSYVKKIPLLLNVLNGDMALFGYESVISLDNVELDFLVTKSRPNALPGVLVWRGAQDALRRSSAFDKESSST